MNANPETSPENTPENVVNLADRMNPKQLKEMKEREKAMLDKAAGTAADMLTPAVAFVRNLGWVKKLDADWKAKRAEMTDNERREMWVEGNLDTLLNIPTGIIPEFNLPHPKEDVIKLLLLTGAIGDLEDEQFVSMAGEKNFVQKSLLLLVKLWGKSGDPDGKVVSEFITKYLSFEGFGLAVCTKIRRNLHNPELMQGQTVVAEVDHEREGTSATVGIPPADHVHDVDDDVAAAA